MSQTYYEYREPGTVEELEALLRLRYQVYMESRLHNFIAENELGLDLDCYDRYSMHFGLFRHEEGNVTPVGYMRLATDEPQAFEDQILAIATQDERMMQKVLQKPPFLFPLMSYAPAREQIVQLHRELRERGERIVEPGRFSLHPSARGRDIATHMVAANFAVVITHGIDQAILSCTSRHGWMYKHFGFSNFPGTGDFHCCQSGENSMLLLLGVRANTSESERAKVFQMAEAFSATGRICYDPAEPKNYFVPNGEIFREEMSEAA